MNDNTRESTEQGESESVTRRTQLKLLGLHGVALSDVFGHSTLLTTTQTQDQFGYGEEEFGEHGYGSTS
jgi:hypothetical protein